MKKITLLLFTTTFISACSHTTPKEVPHQIINQAVNDTHKEYCSNNLENFSKFILQCYQTPNQSQSYYDKCMLEDIALMIANEDVKRMASSLNQTIPIDPTFISENDNKRRQQQYILPRFGTIKNAVYYFGPGITAIRQTMFSCIMY